MSGYNGQKSTPAYSWADQVEEEEREALANTDNSSPQQLVESVLNSSQPNEASAAAQLSAARPRGLSGSRWATPRDATADTNHPKAKSKPLPLEALNADDARQADATAVKNPSSIKKNTPGGLGLNASRWAPFPKNAPQPSSRQHDGFRHGISPTKRDPKAVAANLTVPKCAANASSSKGNSPRQDNLPPKKEKRPVPNGLDASRWAPKSTENQGIDPRQDKSPAKRDTKPVTTSSSVSRRAPQSANGQDEGPGQSDTSRENEIEPTATRLPAPPWALQLCRRQDDAPVRVVIYPSRIPILAQLARVPLDGYPSLIAPVLYPRRIPLLSQLARVPPDGHSSLIAPPSRDAVRSRVIARTSQSLRRRSDPRDLTSLARMALREPGISWRYYEATKLTRTCGNSWCSSALFMDFR
ncbi:hypothetical protein EJ08DRAFT_168010 [Tothia fuscella]|uniref:Uncharacterized protein n=1 Tax=Tothia fuscella TaxID=1048955 RepID=A0A9P4NUG9_9PEZI|nr:hypothetical protein EJ08DRAFT_168010 [Tothia fuscella]